MTKKKKNNQNKGIDYSRNNLINEDFFETTAKYKPGLKKLLILLWLSISFISIGFFFIKTAIGIIIEATIAFTFAVLLFRYVGAEWKIDFHGNAVYIENTVSSKTEILYHRKRKDFVIDNIVTEEDLCTLIIKKNTGQEKKNDYLLKETKKSTELREYIDKHFID